MAAGLSGTTNSFSFEPVSKIVNTKVAVRQCHRHLRRMGSKVAIEGEDLSDGTGPVIGQFKRQTGWFFRYVPKCPSIVGVPEADETAVSRERR